MANIQDVARRARVSISTVSNVLNGRPDRMREETRLRVEAVIAELGFQPNRAARFLKTGHNPLLGLLVPSIANPMYGSVSREIEDVAQAQYGYRVLLGNTYRNREKEASFFEDLLSHGVRGVIVVSSLVNEEHFRSAVDRGLVVVSYDRRATPDTAAHLDHVSVDNFRAAHMAAQHLIGYGHVDLAFVTAPGRTMSRGDKIDGFMAAAREAGIADTAKVIEGKGATAYGDSELAELGRGLAQEVASKAPRPTGIVAMNDMLAIGLIAGLRDCGLHVPNDLSVVGIDDMYLASFVSPALTSVRLPLAEMARTMVDRVVLRLADPHVQPQEFLFQPTLASRESVARRRS